MHKGSGHAWHKGVWAGCMGTYTLGRHLHKCILRHLGGRTAGRGSCEGEGLLKSP